MREAISYACIYASDSVHLRDTEALHVNADDNAISDGSLSMKIDIF